MEGAPQQRIEIVHEFKYLGIPIAHTFSSQVVSETLSSKLYISENELVNKIEQLEQRINYLEKML
jgi:hypothetical protein